MSRIGYVNPEYGARRNIIGRCPSFSYVRVRSFKSLKEKIVSFFNGEPSIIPYYFWGGIADGFAHVDLYHFWNSIAIWPCRKPYVTTFESILPRGLPEGWLVTAGMESIASKQCRRLIALSESARELQVQINAVRGVGDVVDSKITVLLPPQEVLVDDIAVSPSKDGAFRVIFCGKDFFRKGGSEIVRALVKIRASFPVEAYLIGDYNHVDYASSREVDGADEMRRLIDGNSSWLHHWNRMPNDEMLKLAKTCHIGLLPTRDDTFGYSVLEFQACGLPCITTDIRALPEVNNEEIGWLVSVPKGHDRRADFSSPDKMRELSQIIENGLVEKLCEALSQPEAIRDKGLRAIENLKARHSPEEFGRRLGDIYREAL